LLPVVANHAKNSATRYHTVTHLGGTGLVKKAAKNEKIPDFGWYCGMEN